jgi:hypothetical protein
MRTSRILALPALAVLALGLASGSASASTLSEGAAIADAPDCIDVSSKGRTATAYNGCDDSERIKFIWAFAPDSSCRSVSAGKSTSHTSSYVTARFDGIQDC